MRVVSTLPAATEIACALGVEPVGVSHACDHPAVTNVPAVTEPRVDTTAASGALDEAVDESESVFTVDGERLASLEPDIVLTQGLCEVCAVDRETVEDALASVSPELAPTYLTLSPSRLRDVLADIRRIGAATDREPVADQLVASLEDRIDRVEADAPDTTPRVAILDWLDPVMVAGHWTADLVRLAGGHYGLADPAAHSRPREWETIRSYDPEILVLAPCGFDLERTTAELSALADRPGLSSLTAVREDRVWAMDGSRHLNRPGPGLVDTLESLGAIIDPEIEPTDDGVRRVDPAALNC